MKNLAIGLFLVLSLFLTTSARAQSKGDVCFTGQGVAPSLESADLNDSGSNMPPLIATDFMAAGPQCKSLEPYIQALNATSYAFYITSTGITCFGGPLTMNASVVLFGTGFILESLNFIVKNIPCEPNIPTEIIEKRVEEKVCAIMRESGFDCRKAKKQGLD